MPSLIIPDTNKMYLRCNTNPQVLWENSLQGYICEYDTEDATWEGETVSRGEYLSKFLFGKFHNLVTFDVVLFEGSYAGSKSGAMHIDPDNTDDILTFYAEAQDQNYLFGHYYKKLFSISDRKNRNIVMDYRNSIMNGGYVNNDNVYVGTKVFDSFIVFIMPTASTMWYTNTNYATHTVVYDVTNHEIVAFDKILSWLTISAPDARNYARPLTIDGCAGNISAPAFRKCSIEEVIYTPLKRIDGFECTRMYMLTQFPENCEWETLHVGDKYLLVLPYDRTTSSTAIYGSGGHEMHCAVAIDVTEDLENQ